MGFFVICTSIGFQKKKNCCCIGLYAGVVVFYDFFTFTVQDTRNPNKKDHLLKYIYLFMNNAEIQFSTIADVKLHFF